MKGLPELEKKDFTSFLTNASPLGRARVWVRDQGKGLSPAGPD